MLTCYLLFLLKLNDAFAPLPFPCLLVRDLGHEKEGLVYDITQRISDVCGRRGVLLKPFFDDAAQDDHSAKLYGHVTYAQFKQCLSVKVGVVYVSRGAHLQIPSFLC
jgi:hypothetical protein